MTNHNYKITNVTNFDSNQLWVTDEAGELMYTDTRGKNFKVGEVVERLEAVEKRLAILEDPTPKQLENHKMLREAYTKYKFLEELIGKEDDNNG